MRSGSEGGSTFVATVPPPLYTSKLPKQKADSWHQGLSPSLRQDQLESLLIMLKSLADAELGVASVLTNLHHRRIIPSWRGSSASTT
jgi:hypothetical protein